MKLLARAKRRAEGEANGHEDKKGPAATPTESDSSSSSDDDDDSEGPTPRGSDDDDDDDDEGEKPDSPLKADLLHTKRELLSAREMARAYKSLAKSHKEANAYLKADHERKVMQIAKYEMQYCTRTVVHGLLRLAFPTSKATGGAMYKQFLRTVVLKTIDDGCLKLSTKAQQLYDETVMDPEFLSLEKGALTSWVTTFKEEYGNLNENQHSLPELDALWIEAGVACGGGNVERMFKHVIVIGMIQRHCIAESIDILPAFLGDVAVLSPELNRVVGRITRGGFVATPKNAAKKAAKNAAKKAAKKAAASSARKAAKKAAKKAKAS